MSNPTLGGSVFVHNAVKFDYCIRESVSSLCELCDKVVVMDAESDDDTVELILPLKEKYNNLLLVQGAKWECHERYERLALLANQAKNLLRTDWHFMLQADEVIHEDSYHWIRKAIKNNKGCDSYRMRRINFFGDTDHHFKFDLAQDRKPVSDAIDRLAHLRYNAVGDAESLGVDPSTNCCDWIDKIQIWHYGFVRDERLHCDKVINMQSWFHGPDSTPDHRVVEMKNTTGYFDWKMLKERSDLVRRSKEHPKVAQEWVAARQARRNPVE